jgi:hypothetical protein
LSALNLDEQIRAKTQVLRQYAETDSMVHVRGLLDLLDRSYKEQLADVAAADLAKTQGALKQVTSLRDAVFGPDGLIPRL